MGHGHSHSAAHAAVEVGARARNALVAFLVMLGVLATAGLIWLWPDSTALANAVDVPFDAPGVTYEEATIRAVTDGCPSQEGSGYAAPCQSASVELTTGEDAGRVVEVELQGPQAQAGLRAGDSIEVARIPTDDGPLYSYSGTNRLPTLLIMGLLFVVCVLAVARWRGLFALLGLGFAGFVLLGFMLPALITGKPGMAVALTGSTAIMFVVLYVAHGVSIRTSTALAGTLLGLAVTTGLGSLAVGAARLSGFADEQDYDLAQLVPGLDFQELLLCAIIIGGLGVLNDVTITQSSAVWELRAAAPEMSRARIFASAMRIGRDHIASTIYTIVFAYAGGALTVLLLLYFTNREVIDLFGVEMFAGEGVRTFASAIGLVLSVPITTGIAAMTVAPARIPPSTPRHIDPHAPLPV
ncbi:YibE/F family protein [Tessaracoccus antarcticus]|uniref:YibE/F family protein n=1 Tax=Tessaracoccus antarcticus TaxID=2479848 RepID=A0A3M0GK98_9ACTN|nr:YibE/F family protein [Tessaracoccus antarcticus]RMB61569.1 YibE/F family protein [Tessaracoccus antarcticus]